MKLPGSHMALPGADAKHTPIGKVHVTVDYYLDPADADSAFDGRKHHCVSENGAQPHSPRLSPASMLGTANVGSSFCTQ